MALNLSTLTSPATSGDVLQEVTTTADFLESVPVFRNLARGSNKGGDAKQDVALNQPKALPLIGNEGYLYCSGVAGNSATIPHDSSLNLTDQLEVVARLKYRSYSGADAQCIVCKWASGDFNFRFHTAGYLQVYYKDSSGVTQNATSDYTVYNNNISDGETIWVKMTIDATSTSTDIDFYTSKDNVKNEEDVTWTALGTTITITTNGGITSGTNPVSFGAFDNSGAINDDLATGAVLKANYKATIGGSPVLDVDFTSPNVRHGATKFECATGQVVTINQSGNDPATIIKKPVLRFDGVNDNLKGLLGTTVTEGYAFLAFSVLGGGGEQYSTVFGINSTGGTTISTDGYGITHRNAETLQSINANFALQHYGLFDDANGDILHEAKFTSGSQISKINNADQLSSSATTTISSEEFSIAERVTNGLNTAFDLEYLALFPATITDAQADAVRNYINNRNNVFDLKDGFGYYFYDAQKAPVGNITDVNTWNGRIIGSDNGDTDKLATQATANDQPVGDGYVVTFADNSDFLTIPSTTQAGWQVVGTSLGTFAYKVNANAVTELNLLGNLGNALYRKAGDLYGIILLPESATGKDINEARKLLIDRGAADGTTASNYFAAWVNRVDIVKFKNVDMTSATAVSSSWEGCSSLSSFDVSLPAVTNVRYTWFNCSSLSDFRTTNIKNGTNFTSAWQGCSALTSFPSDAKLGTDATNVNFTSAWYSSGLTSFSTPLPTATNVYQAWSGCTSLTSFSTDLPLVTNVISTWSGCTSLTSFSTDLPSATNVVIAWQGCSSLTSFSTDLPSVTNASRAWQSCTSLTSFSTELPLADNVTNAWNGCSSLTSFSTLLPSATIVGYAWFGCSSLTSFSTELPSVISVPNTWRNCTSLTDFSADVFANWNPSSITSGVFHNTWDGCSSLTAQSVENILTSIDASGHYATENKVSGGTALTDAGIDIDYNGDPLSAATTAAIDSLSGKGWQVFINGELVIPNILTLQPAAAYSLRSFDADADPNVVNVRRSSDGATSDFTASEVSDGTLVAFVGAGNDGHVTTWYDQGGTNHATQSTASAQPKIVDGGTLVTENGLAALDFDGTSDSLEIPAGLISNLDTMLVSAVLTNSDGNNDYGVVLGEPNSRIYVPYISSSYLYIGYADSAVKLQDGAYSNGLQLITLSVDSSTASGFKNGQAFSDVATATASNNAPIVTSNANRIGSYGSLAGAFDFSEVVIFNTDQSANRTGIEAEIMDTYSIS